MLGDFHNRMRIFIRTDASVNIGTGHVIRCLTLADRLKPYADVIFACQELEGNLIPYIRKRGYRVRTLRETLGSWEADADNTLTSIGKQELPVDWLIVDHYGLDARYESVMRAHVKRVMVIDDLADRPHRCDLLLDQNPYEYGELRYEGLIEENCKLLLGPEYALLRPEFAEARELVDRTGSVRSILVSFGGVDFTGETIKTLRALEPLVRNGLQVKVLIGKINQQSEQIHEIGNRYDSIVCFDHVENVAALMKDADLAIGSGGTTTWERCCMGLPAIVIMTADNQVELSEHSSKRGVISLLGRAEEVKAEHIRDRVIAFMQSDSEMINMSAKGLELVDGLGTDRTVKELLKCTN